jgi:hypothetical protein
MANIQKENESKTAWSISIGTYPGILFGIRSYRAEDQTTIVIYVPFIDIAIDIYK